MTFHELLPPLPEGQNKALELIGLCTSLRTGAVLTFKAPPALKEIAPGKALLITKQNEWFSSPRSPDLRWEQLAEDLKLNSKTLDELRAMARSPVLRYPINYRGLSTLLPHLAKLKTGALHLSAAALHNMRIGRIEAAVDDIEAIVLLSRVSADEPILISQLVRIAIVSIALQDCWPLLHAEQIPDEQLARLQRILNVDLTTGMLQALRGERVMARDMIHTLRSTDESFDSIIESLSSMSADDGESSGLAVPYNDEVRGAIRAMIIVPLWRYLWSYEDERHTLEEIQTLLAAIEQSRAQHSAVPLKSAGQAIDKKIKEGSASQSWSYYLTRAFLTSPHQAPLRAFRYQTHRELTLTAIALKRYQLRHGKYPKTLDELIPEFLRTHPIDWMDGQKLRYRLDGDSFLVWSVGDDGKDDGGTPDDSPPYNFFNGPDMVWPQPASSAEVEAYNERTKTTR